MVWVNWEEFVGKKIKIVQKDGFIKHGILKDVSDNFLTLEFDNGDLNIIKKDFVLSIVVMKEDDKQWF